MKNTKQRSVILSIINNSNNHLDAYEIYDMAKREINNISLGTVYRNLCQLERHGMVISIVVNGVKHYDKVVPHHHFICKRCGKIIDVFDLDVPVVSMYQNNIVTDYELVLKGICIDCQKEDKNGIKRK